MRDRIDAMAAAIVGAAMIGAAVPAAGQTAMAADPLAPAAGTVLDVTAEGRTTRVPDLATVRAGVTTEAPTAADALADNAARVAQVIAALLVIDRRDPVGGTSIDTAADYR